MADAPSVNVLGFAGSLRKGSFNRMLLRAAVELAPPAMTIETIELDSIPLYNGDVEAQGDPEPVAEWKDAIRRADAILVVTPEYNYGIPGVLKNAIDWASRPPGKSVLNGKPAAIMGASPGGFGSVRAQLQLRQVFVFTADDGGAAARGAGGEGPREVRRGGTADRRADAQVRAPAARGPAGLDRAAGRHEIVIPGLGPRDCGMSGARHLRRRTACE